MNLRRMLLIVLAIAATAGLYLFNRAVQPPSEAKVTASFDQHRATYESLRTMLLSDDTLVSVADWGVETTESPLAEVPPHGTFPESRYREYLSLLTDIKAKAAARTEGTHPEARILVWASGFAGETRHIAICWVKEAPVNQTRSLDAFYKSPKPRHPVYKHLDGNWYIWADW